jgi:outer membrane protein OmpA-like peptidoglycan-associated protein
MKRGLGLFKAGGDSSFSRSLTMFFLLILCAFAARAQTREGKWMLGLQGGPHIMLNDFDTKKPAWGGEALLRYGLSENFSLGFLTGYNEIKAENSYRFPNINYTYLKMHAIPATLMGWLHFTPTNDLSPYLYVGAGVVAAKKRDGLGNYIPNSNWQTYSVFPAGVGLEVFLDPQTALAFDLGIRVFGSDNVEREETDAEHDRPDAYATARVGVSFYFGEGKAAEVEEAPPIVPPPPAPVAQPVAPAVPETAKVAPKPPAPEVPKEVPKEEAVPKAPVPVVPKEEAVALEKGKGFILEGVNFNLNSSVLTNEAKTTLDKVVTALRENPEVKVKIVGHTDNIGSKKYNDWLSLRRAKSVKSYLVSKGISSARLTTAGVGFSEPIATNDTPEGRAKNRRIEFHVE